MSDNIESVNSLEVERYVESCRRDFWQRVFRWETDYLLKHLQGCEKILSVGCGPAVIESKLSESGFGVTGLDVSQEALKRAPDSVRSIVACAECMPIEESSYDAVIYVASLQFIDDYRKAMEETLRVLRPNGKIIVMLLNPESDFVKNSLKNPDSYMNKIKHTNLKSIEDLIAKDFHIQTEYFLGIKGDDIFESHNVNDAALYVIEGKKTALVKGERRLNNESSYTCK